MALKLDATIMLTIEALATLSPAQQAATLDGIARVLMASNAERRPAMVALVEPCRHCLTRL